MSKNTSHTVIISSQFAERNFQWLNRFVFCKEDNNLNFFSCKEIQDAVGGMVKFCGVLLKSNEDTEDILLPYHVIEGALLDQTHKNQLGFLSQGESPDK